YGFLMPIPKEKVSDNAEEKILSACNKAMQEYNEKHIDIIEYKNCTPVWTSYPPNYFLDNNIGKLELNYDEHLRAWRTGFRSIIDTKGNKMGYTFI
ncbi:MAG: hypothetical protein IJ736_12530, partial [Firmicutes bacterium]|nr:hypothetical protein [Bacillota bacterium]